MSIDVFFFFFWGGAHACQLLETFRNVPSISKNTKLKTISCSVAEKMAKDQRSFCTQSLWEANRCFGPLSSSLSNIFSQMNKAEIILAWTYSCMICEATLESTDFFWNGLFCVCFFCLFVCLFVCFVLFISTDSCQTKIFSLNGLMQETLTSWLWNLA